MTRHTLRLDPTTRNAYCTECGAEFRPPLDPGTLMHEECRKDAPASEHLAEWIEITSYRDNRVARVRKVTVDLSLLGEENPL